MKFKEWFDRKLIVTRYPNPSDIIDWEVDYVINVSDEYISDCHTTCNNNNIKYFWFPMDEISSDIGVNSIYGALQILWLAEKENAKVLLHCHAGANRSPTVAESYYFLRTKTYLEKKKSKESIETCIKLFNDDSEYFNSRILDNINQGFLPSVMKYEKFLKDLEKAFISNEEAMLNQIKFDCRL